METINARLMERWNYLLEAVLPYEPEKMRDDQLADDWRIFGGWYSTLKKTGKFKYTVDEILNKFTIPALKEILKRGKQEFHPDRWKENPKELYLKAFGKVKAEGIKIPDNILKESVEIDTSNKNLQEARHRKDQCMHCNKSPEFVVLWANGHGRAWFCKSCLKEWSTNGDGKEDIISIKKVNNGEVLPKWADNHNSNIIAELEKEFGYRLREQIQFKPEEWDAKVISELKDAQLLEKLHLIAEIFEARGSNPQDEEVINAYILLTAELKKRKIEFSVVKELEQFAKKLREGWLDNFLMGKMKEIQEIGNIILVPNYVNWTGSSLYVKDRMPNDLDIVIRDSKINPDWFLKIKREMQKVMETEPCFHMTPTGPNWRHLPVLHLGLIPVKNPEFVEVGKEEPGYAERFYEQRAASPEIRKEAEQSEKEDRVKVGRFFLMQKPTRAAKPNHRMSIDYFISLFKPEDFKAGILSSKKYDGMAIQIHKDGDKIKIWSEDGEDITPKLPTLVDTISKLDGESFVLGAELEMWIKDKHQPREAVAGKIHEKEVDDTNLIANVFTLMYHKGEDVHKKTEIERQDVLKKFGFPQSTWGVPDVKMKINLVPNLVSNSAQELRKHTNFVWRQVASEGNVAKKVNSIYYLDGRSRDGWIKWHANALIYGIVLKRNPTKVETVFNYDYAIQIGKYKVREEDIIIKDNKKYIRVGTTFNTDEKKKEGDLIAVECETFNLIENKKKETTEVTAWAPRFIYLEQTEEEIPKYADSIDDVVAEAKKNRILQKKTITPEGETLYEEKHPFWEDLDDEHIWLVPQDADNLIQRVEEDLLVEMTYEMEVPPFDFEGLIEAKRPLKEYPKDYAVLISHFRGKSSHLDFRRKQNGFLEGETIINAPAGLITEPVDSLAKAKKWNAELLKKGKFRPDMDPKKKAVLVGKARQPLEWMNVREVIYPPSSVGATKFEWGAFVTMDEGMAYPGVQRPYFKEFFLDMKYFKKQRMVERLIGVAPEWEKPPKAPTQWQSWTNMEDETPYILSKRQRKDKRDYIPKEGEKAIPPWWEKEIKPDHRWWVKDLKPKERMKRLDLAYNDLIEKGLIKARPIEMKEEVIQEVTDKFILRFRWWMGPKVVRELPATDSRYELLIDTGKKSLDRWILEGKFYGDPTKQESVNATRTTMNIQTPNGESFKEWMDWEGSIPAKDSRLREVIVLKKIRDGIYSVRDKQGNEIETKQTFAEFSGGDKAWIDQWENLYTGNKGGMPYGNPNERIPAYIEIKDSGTVNWIEDTAQFSSFKFNGKSLKGYWIMKRLDPKQDIWVFSMGQLPGEKMKEFFTTETEIVDTVTWDVTSHTQPIEIKYNTSTYSLIPTKNGKLILNKS